MPRQRVSSWIEVGSRVAAARTAAGFTQAELSERVGLHRSGLTRVEQGQRHLDALELFELASALGRSVDWFLAMPPAGLASHRRSGDESEDELRLEDELEAATRDVELLNEIGELRISAAPSLGDTPFETLEQAAHYAMLAREALGSTGPIHDLQTAVQELGLLAYSLPLGPQVIDGGYARLAEIGVAVINGAGDSGRRRFSVAHELGHHLLADEYATDFAIGQARADRESLINAFAIHFLMPGPSVTQRWDELVREGHASYSAAVVLAAEFRVSWSAACAQIRNLGVVDREQYDQLVHQRPGPVDYIELDVSFGDELDPVAIPPAVARAALSAYRHYKVGRSRTLELMRGTLSSDDLPEPDDLPMKALHREFVDLE